MTLLTGFNATGTAITDEKILCDEDYASGGNTYYRGYFDFLPNSSMEGSGSTYGCWTAVSKGGSQKEVLLEGFPANNTQVSVDLQNGYLYSYDDDTTLYVRYLAHAPIVRYGKVEHIYIPGILLDGVAQDVHVRNVRHFMKVSAMGGYIHGAVSGTATDIYVRNATAGGGDGDYFQFPISSRTTTVREFTTPVKINKSQQLVIRTADGNGISDVSLYLYEV